MTALIPLSIMAIYLGRVISNKNNKEPITKIAGTAFIIIGIIIITSIFFS